MTHSTSGPHQLDARKFVRDGLRRLISTTVGVERESELKKWFEVKLGLSYSAAARKLAGDTALEERDYQTVAQCLGMTFEDLLLSLSAGGNRVKTAEVEFTSPPMLAKVVLGDLVKVDSAYGLVAFESNGEWHVNDASRVHQTTDLELYKVLSLNLTEGVERRLLFAVIDDDERLTQSASDWFKLEGIDSRRFSDETSLLDTLQKTRYDAYIVDWFLSKDQDGSEGETSENLIRKIRASENGKTAPIVIVSGEISGDTDLTAEEVYNFSEEFNCIPMTKPVLWRFVTKAIKDELNKGHTLGTASPEPHH